MANGFITLYADNQKVQTFDLAANTLTLDFSNNLQQKLKLMYPGD